MVDLAISLAAGIFATFIPLVIGLIYPKVLSRLPFALAVSAGVVAGIVAWAIANIYVTTVVAAIIGLVAGVGVGGVASRVIHRTPSIMVGLMAFSAGLIFWFFIDVMGDAAQLDINQGFGGGYAHLALGLSFGVGVTVLFGLERRFSLAKSTPSTDPDAHTRSIAVDITFAIAAVAALGIGFHALGEGMDIGVSLPKAVTLYDAIGGVYPGVAYVLHKFFEGFVIGSFAVVANATRLRHIGILAALSGIPTVIGFFIGLPATLDSTYMFALGGAGALYVEMKLIPVLARSGRLYAAILPLLLGFYAMYTAGLFHSVGG